MSESERLAVSVIVGEFAVEDEIERFVPGGDALNWESFLWGDQPGEGLVFVGSTRLPDSTMAAMGLGLVHWGRMLGKIRSEVFPELAWDVHVEGEPLGWIEDELRFGEPTSSHIDWDSFE